MWLASSGTIPASSGEEFASGYSAKVTLTLTGVVSFGSIGELIEYLLGTTIPIDSENRFTMTGHESRFTK